MTKAKKLNISYEFDTNYCIFSPTDAYGGINPKGKLIMSLFTDIHKIPDSQICNLDDKGKIKKDEIITLLDDSKETAKTDILYIDRIFHNTVILHPDSAIEIAFWMIDNILKSPIIEIDKKKLKERFLKMIGLEEKKNE